MDCGQSAHFQIARKAYALQSARPIERKQERCLATVIIGLPGKLYTMSMIMAIAPRKPSRNRALISALKSVIPQHQRDNVRELISFDTGNRKVSPDQLLSWMRVHMPTSAERVDDVMFPQPFRD